MSGVCALPDIRIGAGGILGGLVGWCDGFLGLFQISCLVLFVSVVTSRAIHLYARARVNPIVLRVKKRGLLGGVELALFVQVNLWAGVVVVYSIPGLVSPESWIFGGRMVNSIWIKAVGVSAIQAGFVLLVLAMCALGSSWRLGIDERHPGRLVTTGIYAWSRNPIYVFFGLYFVGTFLVNGTWLFLLFAVLTVSNLHYQILQEERFLSATYGSAYHAYCARTARYWTWRRVLHLYRRRAAG